MIGEKYPYFAYSKKNYEYVLVIDKADTIAVVYLLSSGDRNYCYINSLIPLTPWRLTAK